MTPEEIENLKRDIVAIYEEEGRVEGKIFLVRHSQGGLQLHRDRDVASLKNHKMWLANIRMAAITKVYDAQNCEVVN